MTGDKAQEGDEPNLHMLAFSLALTNVSSKLLMMPIFIPVSVTVYDSFIVPVVGKLWSLDGNGREIMCQMLTSAALLPCEVVSAMLGFNPSGHVGQVFAEAETVGVELAAKSTQLIRKWQDEHDPTRVDRERFCKAVKAVGIDAPRAELDALFDEVDEDVSGTVGSRELHAVHVLRCPEPRPTALLLCGFHTHAPTCYSPGAA